MRAALVLVLALAGCTSARTIRGPDGEAWLAISCTKSQTYCWERAGMECPHGYDVADEQGHGGTMLVANRTSAYAAPTFTGELLVRCKP